MTVRINDLLTWRWCVSDRPSVETLLEFGSFSGRTICGMILCRDAGRGRSRSAQPPGGHQGKRAILCSAFPAFFVLVQCFKCPSSPVCLPLCMLRVGSLTTILSFTFSTVPSTLHEVGNTSL